MKNSQDATQLFDPEDFRVCGHALIDVLTEYLDEGLHARSKVLNWIPPEEAFEHWKSPLPYTGTVEAGAFNALLRDEVLEKTLRIHHPRNMGHQVAPPLPIAALCDLVSALTNQAMAVYETGPSATMIERQVIRWLAELAGFHEAEGFLTSGGAQANLTALLAARQCMADFDVWREGVGAGLPMRILASEHAHYSISRAAGIMGMGAQAVIPVAADAAGRLQIESLQQAWENSVIRGEYPFAVVATAGCTPTGSIDPLSEIAYFCESHKLWMHVDGAHGASGLLSNLHRTALTGIDRADSVVWDGHKLLYMPATVSAVIFRNPKNSYAAFAQEASYLFQDGGGEAEAFNTSYRTLECTKRMMGLKLWAVFSIYGVDALGSLVDRVYATARRFADMLATSKDFELLMLPQTNIVCFRYLRKDGSHQGGHECHQAALRRRLVENGSFYLAQVGIRGEVWLRVTIMNPLTREDDLRALIEDIRGE